MLKRMRSKVAEGVRCWTYRQITTGMLRDAIRCRREVKLAPSYSAAKGSDGRYSLGKNYWRERAQNLFLVWRELCDGLITKSDYQRFQCVVGFGGRALDRSDMAYFRSEDREFSA